VYNSTSSSLQSLLSRALSAEEDARKVLGSEVIERAEMGEEERKKWERMVVVVLKS
jgi:hypothetical protein